MRSKDEIFKISPELHLLHSNQFDEKYLLKIFRLTDQIKREAEKYSQSMSGKIVATLFYEASTRTRLSFESAANRLGAKLISVENANEFSSAAKGESLEDSVRVIASYADILILRHFGDDSAERALSVLPKGCSLINAGSGKSQHPSQALLDLYSIFECFGRLDNLRISLVGDLLRGRTCDSLVYSLAKFKGNSFTFVAPENSKIKKELKSHLEKENVEFKETSNLEDALKTSDVLYVTRIQKERFENQKEYESAKGRFVLNSSNIKFLNKNAIIMHPLPRVDEISPELDADPRAYYFKQAANGLWVRMALLKNISENLDKEKVLTRSNARPTERVGRVLV